MSPASTNAFKTGRTRLPLLPQVPIVEAAGLAGYEAGLWMGLFAPRGTPAPVIDPLSSALRTALDDPEVKTAINAQGLEVTPGTPEQLGSLVKSEIRKWSHVVQAAGIEPE